MHASVKVIHKDFILVAVKSETFSSWKTFAGFPCSNGVLEFGILPWLKT